MSQLKIDYSMEKRMRLEETRIKQLMLTQEILKNKIA